MEDWTYQDDGLKPCEKCGEPDTLRRLCSVCEGEDYADRHEPAAYFYELYIDGQLKQVFTTIREITNLSDYRRNFLDIAEPDFRATAKQFVLLSPPHLEYVDSILSRIEICFKKFEPGF